MDIYKLKFTVLQQEMIRFLAIKAGKSFPARRIAQALNVSPTAIAKALPYLEKEKLITIIKDKESKRLAIEINRENPKVIAKKRILNLELLYESGLVEYLSEQFPAKTVILFLSYSFF